jgi:hypothetical protein
VVCFCFPSDKIESSQESASEKEEGGVQIGQVRLSRVAPDLSEASPAPLIRPDLIADPTYLYDIDDPENNLSSSNFTVDTSAMLT